MSSPIQPTPKTEIIPLLVLVLVLFSSFYFYANFPLEVATHWNAQGQPDGWSSRGFAAFFFPVLILGFYFLFLGLPYIDPKRSRYKEFAKAYHVFKGVFVVFMSLIYWAASASGLGYAINIGRVVPAGIGLLFIILGYYMPQIKSNWFIGIRTPWTLSSEKVWKKTHQIGGKVFIFDGLVFFWAALFPAFPFWLVMTILLVTILGVIAYSYFLYQKDNKKK